MTQGTNDGLLITIKRELAGVEASLEQVDGLIHEARDNRDLERRQKYQEQRRALLQTRDELAEEIEKLRDDDTADFSKRWEAFKNALTDFLKAYGG